jgi:hypothetical protein
MSEETATTRLQSLLRFPFQGADWSSRFIIGTGLTLAAYVIPLVPIIFVYGYVLRVMRQATEGEELTLPAWTDWGQLFVDGLRVALVGLVYLLPGVLVLVGGWMLYFVSSFAFPLMMGVVGQDTGGAALVFVLGMMGLFGSMAVLMLSMAFGFFLVILAFIPLPAAVAHFIASDEVAAAFRPRQWWPILRANAVGYFAAWVVMLGLASLAAIALNFAYYTIVLCCLAPFLAAPLSLYVLLVSAALFGQTYREGSQMVTSS